VPRKRQKRTKPLDDFRRVFDSLPFKLDMRALDARQDEECIGADSDCDLATPAISPVKVDRQGKQFYRASRWPP